MPIIVLKTSTNKDQYLLWSTTTDAPLKHFAHRWELRCWYTSEKYSPWQLGNAIKILADTGTDSDEGYGGFCAEHIPVGESLCPPDGWWRIARTKLPELFERVELGLSAEDLLERYA